MDAESQWWASLKNPHQSPRWAQIHFEPDSTFPSVKSSHILFYIFYIYIYMYILYWHYWLSPINLYASLGHSFTLNMRCGRVYGPFEVGCDLTIWVKSQKMLKNHKIHEQFMNIYIYIYIHIYIYTYIYIYIHIYLHNYIWTYHNLEMKIHKSHQSLWGGRA